MSQFFLVVPNRLLCNKIGWIYGFFQVFRLYGSFLEAKTVHHISGTQCREVEKFVFLLQSQNLGKLPDIARRHSILASRRYQNGVLAHSLAQDEIEDQILVIDHLPGFANEIFKKDHMPTQDLSLPKFHIHIPNEYLDT